MLLLKRRFFFFASQRWPSWVEKVTSWETFIEKSLYRFKNSCLSIWKQTDMSQFWKADSLGDTRISCEMQQYDAWDREREVVGLSYLSAMTNGYGSDAVAHSPPLQFPCTKGKTLIMYIINFCPVLPQRDFFFFSSKTFTELFKITSCFCHFSLFSFTIKICVYTFKRAYANSLFIYLLVHVFYLLGYLFSNLLFILFYFSIFFIIVMIFVNDKNWKCYTKLIILMCLVWSLIN